MAEPQVFEPYVGPQPFGREHTDRFYGRRVEARELLALVVGQQVVVLYSQSGAGKTSLLHAGLRPLLESRGFDLPPVARVLAPGRARRDEGNVFIEAGVASLRSESGDGAVESRSLTEALAHRPRGPDAPRALIFDQFEEIFESRPERWEDRRGFFEDVAAALQADRLLRVVFSLREEYVAQLEPYAELLPGELEGRYRLARLGPEGALLAVTGPLKVTEWRFEPNVAEQLVKDLRTIHMEIGRGKTEPRPGEFVEAVQLQVVCRRLWRALNRPPRSDGSKGITVADVRRHADPTRALSDFYEEALTRAVKETGEEEWKLRSLFDKHLITPAGTRGFTFRGVDQTAGVSNDALKVLERERIVRGEQRAGSYWFELTHDRLIRPIQEANERAREHRPSTVDRRRVVLALLALLSLAATATVLVVLGRVGVIALRGAVVAVLAVLPAWLYVAFVRFRVAALWEEFVLNLFKLDIDEGAFLPEPPGHSRYHKAWAEAGGSETDVGNVYLRKFEAVYGRGVLAARQGYGRIAFSRGEAVVLVPSTLLLLIGWWTLVRPDAPRIRPPLYNLVDPGALSDAAPLMAAFVGAYCYALQIAVRRYFDGTLKASVYTALIGRVIMALAVTGGMSLLAPETYLGTLTAVAFVIGFFPLIGLSALQKIFNRVLWLVVPAARSDYPLSDLDGLTVWYEAELLHAGIDDLQNLASVNLVDVLLNTRVPVARLVDWIDQACLYLRLGRPEWGRDKEEAFPDRESIRRLGVRTATDLERMLCDQRDDLYSVLGETADSRVALLRLHAAGFRDEPNLKHVRAWRRETGKVPEIEKEAVSIRQPVAAP